jgi:TPR repeat protein
LQTAFTWYKKAAELGDADSASTVAHMLRDGTGVAKDEAAALQWFLKAFEMKSPEAAGALSQIYAFGMLDQPKDPEKSKFYHAKSREYRKWWAESHGFPDKKQKTFLRKVLGIVRKASGTGSI